MATTTASQNASSATQPHGRMAVSPDASVAQLACVCNAEAQAGRVMHAVASAVRVG